jgi:hypothetical protein
MSLIASDMNVALQVLQCPGEHHAEDGEDDTEMQE